MADHATSRSQVEPARPEFVNNYELEYDTRSPLAIDAHQRGLLVSQLGSEATIITDQNHPWANSGDTDTLHLHDRHDTAKVVKAKDLTAEVEELTSSSPPEKNWRGIVIAVLVIITMVLAIIAVAIIVITPKSGDTNTAEPFTFKDFFSANFRPRSFGMKWVGEKDIYVYQSKYNELMEYDCSRYNTSLIMGNVTFKQPSTNLYSVSEDLEYVLLKHDVKMVYRYSYFANFTIYHRYARDPESKLIQFPQGVGKDWMEKKLQYASWSPKGHSLVFIYDNNLYYQQDPFTNATRISASGVPGRIYNGIAEWLYEEELLFSTVAHWWSADGTYLCYAHFDDSNVPTYKFPTYGPGSQIYDNIKEVHFPKAGDTGRILPKVRLLIVNLTNLSMEHKHIKPPVELRGRFQRKEEEHRYARKNTAESNLYDA